MDARHESSKYRLVYFHARARAELIRLAFAAADVPFEDVRVSYAEFKEMKARRELPFEQLPLLEVAGEIRLAQSMTIARFVARRHGLVPDSDVDQARMEMVVDGVADIAGVAASSRAAEAAVLAEFRRTTLPAWLGHFSRLLAETGGENFVRGKLTLADLAVFNFLDEAVFHNPPALDAFPDLADFHRRIGDLPRLKQYLMSRPTSLA